MGYQIVVTDKAKDFICEKGWDAQFGARPLKRAIQKYIEDALAEEIIKTKLVKDDIIHIDFDESSSSIKISVTKPEPTPKEMAKSK
jgi:ATP-dependent Clp protease ATP-binding subunit ClpC